jgi:hypothetical protein
MGAVFSDVTSCSLTEGCQRIGGRSRRHIQFSFTVKVEAVGPSETVVNYQNTRRYTQ